MTNNYGWICPKCQRVYAPVVQECEGCKPEDKPLHTSGFANVLNQPPIDWMPIPDTLGANRLWEHLQNIGNKLRENI